MNKRFHKRALSVSAALLTLTSAVSTVNASQRNEITIDSDLPSVSSGDSFIVSVGYEPDGVGASGFTIDLHYDTEAVDLNVSESGEYKPTGGFAIVTNFEAGEGVVRMVGANLSGENVTDDTVISKLSFTVKDGYYGDIDFWTDVDTLVASDGEDFINVDYRAHGPYDPYTVSGPEKVSSSQPAVTTVPTETTSAETEPEETETTTTEVTTEPTLPDEYIPETTTTAETTAAPSDTEPEITDESSDAETEPPQTDDDLTSDGSDALFVHKQGDSDYNNEEALQYAFSPYDYVDSADEPVDIKVSVSCTGSAQGGIGMLTSDGWTIYSCSTNGGEQIWEADGVDLDDVSGDIAVQLYYLRNNSEFSVNSISIEPSFSENVSDPEPDEDVSPEDVETDADADDVDDAEYVPDNSDVSQDVQPDDNSQTTDDGSDVSGETPSDEITDEPKSESISENTDPEETPDSVSDETLTADTSSENSDSAAQTTAASQVESTVTDASAKADGNPDTGSGIGKYICFGIIILCAGQMAYSIYALVRKTEE